MERDQVNAQEESNNSSPRKLLGGGSSGGCDRLKRDEWSEGAVSSLLEAYESKWVLRNRAKLKGQDWEDVARHVSSRANSTKSPKTQTQCKNKIESMKKRYRSESAVAASDHSSSWPLFSRLDHLMRGTGSGGGCGGGVNVPPPPPPPPSIITNSPLDVEPAKSTTPLVLLESFPPAPPQPPPPPPAPPPPQPCFLTVETAQNSPKSNGGERIEKEEEIVLGGEEAKLSDQVSDDHNKNTIVLETDSSTPALYGSKDTTRSKINNSNNNNNNNNNRIKKVGDKRKRRRVSSSREDMDLGIAQSIQLLAEAVVRSEQARMETMRELERMRVEAEARRDEMDLKRTEIIANTQLEIARIFAACSNSGGKSVDSCPGIAKNYI